MIIREYHLASRIILIEDDPMLAEAVVSKLTACGHLVDHVESGEAGLEKCLTANYDIAILDYVLPGMNGLETLKQLKAQLTDLPVIFFTSHGNNELAWQCLQLGANEYLNKPFNFDNLCFYVFKLLKIYEPPFDSGAQRGDATEDIVYRSPVIEKIVARIPFYASCPYPVLISGETGTGKDIFARAIIRHPSNPRRGKPCFSINCMAIPENLIESELFGHARGAFTGALVEKQGFFEEANGGTMFLDEISGASQSVQGKLLRIIENGEYYRMGETKLRKTDVRIVAATNRDLFDEIHNGSFRQDLFYRLNGLVIDLPPLCEHPEDIEPLALHFLRAANLEMSKSAVLSPSALKTLEAYGWPGNIRQLRNTVFVSVAMSEKDEIGSDDLQGDFRRSIRPRMQDNMTLDEMREAAVDKVEREYFSDLLRRTHGNVTVSAAETGIARQNLTKKLKKLGIDPGDFR